MEREAITDTLLDQLRTFDALRGGDDLLTETVDSIAPAYADGSVFETLTPRIAELLRARGITRLYRHQADAITKAMAGANVVLQAPTASGKTLAFQIPMMERLVRDSGHALMIYPMKALANDQRDQLMRVFGDVRDARGKRIESWWYDGDTEKETRGAIRSSPPHILITNPEMLHRSFLAHADKWPTFLERLRCVVVDEMHEYRGYFGSNVSLLLRRLTHHLRTIGADPQYFLASATCANAKEHAENLTGLSFEEVNATDQLRPRRSYHFVRPDIPAHQYWDVLKLRTVNAGLAGMALGKSVLAFCPTRKFAEECYPAARREVARLREDGRADLDMSAIRIFRGGLKADDRHEIQDGLRAGTIRLVFTTNALELGIDIGSLDGVILAGFPDSIMSAWQRIGRAGRSWESDAFVLYYARNNPLDQFYASNLPTFLRKPLDELVVNPNNEELVNRHLPCLLYETAGVEDGRDVLGTGLYEAASAKIKAGGQPARIGNYRPHFSVDIRGGGGGMYTLKLGATEIGTLSAHQQFKEAYQRAIYMHGGTNYRVAEVSYSSDGGTVQLAEAPDHLRTRTASSTSINVRDQFTGIRWRSGANVMYGNVTVTEYLWSATEFNERTEETIDSWQPEPNNSHHSNAHAFWLQIEGADSQPGVLELQHLLRLGTLFTIPVEPHDVTPHAVTSVGEQAAYLIENFAGGIGIARKVFERWRDVLETGIRIAEACGCVRGCPNCIVPPRSTDDLDKRRGIELARQVLSSTDRPHDDELRSGLWEPVA